MTANDIRVELFARGFQFLNDGSTEAARVLQWVNEAVWEIQEEADWPFLEAATSGAAPLALTRARNVESVSNTTDGQELDWAPHRWLLDIYGTIPAGTPKYWYVQYSATDNITVYVAPTAADTIAVRYYQHSAVLTTGDTPLLPARFHWLAVEGAVRRAYTDSDQHQEAAACEAVRQQGLAAMKRTMLAQGKPSPNLTDIKEQSQVVDQTGTRAVKGGQL